MAREIAYQTVGEGRLNRGLKEQKKAIWLTFPLQCGGIALHDFGHACKEANIIKSMKLATFLRRKYDPNDNVRNFTIMVKVMQFTHEGDAFDDLFLQEGKYSQVLQLAWVLLTPKYVKDFHVYIKKILLKVPLDLL